MSGLSSWKRAMRLALAELAEVFDARFGYPMDVDAHVVTDPDPGVDLSSTPVPALRALYSEVGEISMPDVYKGYFVHPVARLGEPVEWGLPTRVETHTLCEDVWTFGSDGGGGLFSLVASGSVWYLPNGRIEGGTYSGGLEDPRLVAPTLEEFLGLLLVAVREFTSTGRVTGPIGDL